MKQLGKYIVFAYVLACLCLAAVHCRAQCPPSGCPVPFGPQPYYAPPAQPAMPNVRPTNEVLDCVVRVYNNSSAASGTVIAVSDGYGLVITCNHLLTNDLGQNDIGTLAVQFKDQGKLNATLVEVDAPNDLAAFDVAIPSGKQPVRIAAADPQPNEMVTTIGYGPGSRAYFNGRFVSHEVVMPGFVRGLMIDGVARSGDSGGPALNTRWELVGTIIGVDNLNNPRVIYTSCSGPIRDFFNRILEKWKAWHAAPPLAGVPPKPNDPAKPAPDSKIGDIAEAAGGMGIAWALSALGVGGIPAALAYWLGRRGLHKAIAAIDAKHAAKAEVANSAALVPPQAVVVPPICQYQPQQQPAPTPTPEPDPVVVEKAKLMLAKVPTTDHDYNLLLAALKAEASYAPKNSAPVIERVLSLFEQLKGGKNIGEVLRQDRPAGTTLGWSDKKPQAA